MTAPCLTYSNDNQPDYSCSDELSVRVQTRLPGNEPTTCDMLGRVWPASASMWPRLAGTASGTRSGASRMPQARQFVGSSTVAVAAWPLGHCRSGTADAPSRGAKESRRNIHHYHIIIYAAPEAPSAQPCEAAQDSDLTIHPNPLALRRQATALTGRGVWDVARRNSRKRADFITVRPWTRP